MKKGNLIHIADTEISPTGYGLIVTSCKVSVTVRFLDTGSIGVYTWANHHKTPKHYMSLKNNEQN